ncbi:MAG: hypothetical protein KF768_13035 [Phycisphaeraceae bacterium]|nr:hypothetical protein [Phycisphaeraceae bacterium]
MKTNSIAAVAVAALVAAAGHAQADTIKGKFTSTLSKDVNITSAPRSGTVKTVQFAWQRTDTPGAGIDDTIGNAFTTYCVDLAQNVTANTNFVFNVMTPADYGFNAAQTYLLSVLWADILPQVGTSNDSAAFQLAVWEIVYDSDKALTTGSFKANSPDTPKTIAQGWLNTIAAPGYVAINPLPTLRVLQSDTAQDQLTAISTPIPAPGAGVLALAGMGILAMRRRKQD